MGELPHPFPDISKPLRKYGLFITRKYRKCWKFHCRNYDFMALRTWGIACKGSLSPNLPGEIDPAIDALCGSLGLANEPFL